MRPKDEVKIRFVVNSLETMYQSLGLVNKIDFVKTITRNFVRIEHPDGRTFSEIEIVEYEPQFVASEIAREIDEETPFYLSKKYKKD